MAPDRSQRRRQVRHSSSSLQPSGDREQVGQLECPASPTERRAKPSIIAFLIYELLIQVSLGVGYDRRNSDTPPGSPPLPASLQTKVGQFGHT